MRRLDDLVATETERAGDRAAIATGPEFLVHIAAGNIPNPTLMSMVSGFADAVGAICEVRPTARLCCPDSSRIRFMKPNPSWRRVLKWQSGAGGNTILEEALFAEADCVTATGSDEALTAIRHKLPGRARFLGIRTSVEFWLRGRGCSDVITCQKNHRVARRMTWWRGINWVVFRLTYSMCKRAGPCRRCNSRNNWRRNWSAAKKPSRGGSWQRNKRRPLHRGAQFMRFARRTHWKPICGKAKFHRMDGSL